MHCTVVCLQEMQKRHGRVHLRVISAPLNSQRTLSAGRECRAGVVQTDLWRAVSVCSSSWLRVSSLSWFSRRLRGRKREVVAKQDQEDDTTEEHWEHFQAFLVRLSLPLESCIYAACTVLSAHGVARGPEPRLDAEQSASIAGIGTHRRTTLPCCFLPSFSGQRARHRPTVG